MALHLTANESTFSNFEALSKYLGSHGKPVAFNSDKASVFYVKKRSETAGKGVTQFGRVLHELNSDALCQHESGQGACGAGKLDAAGSAGQGAQVA
ncbi:integrase catalytic subunit [Burkholderia seminalis]|nr:integrase catalytic subunit [Burkholderia seminalis]